MDADRISQTFVFVWDLVLVGDNQLRSVLNPTIFLSAINFDRRDKLSARFDLRPPLQDIYKCKCLLSKLDPDLSKFENIPFQNIRWKGFSCNVWNWIFFNPHIILSQSRCRGRVCSLRHL